MELKIESSPKEGLQIYKVGKFEFQTYAEAEEFVEWISRLFRRRRELAASAEVWAGRQQQERGSGNPVLHDVMTSLAYLSFALAGLNAVETMHLTMIRQISDCLEKAGQAHGGAKMMTKGDVAVIMGDEWAKEHLGTSLIAKLKTAHEPAPQEWVEMARAAQAAPPKKKSSGPSMGM